MDTCNQFVQRQLRNIRIGQKERQIDAVDQHLFAVAVGMLNAENYIKIQPFGRFAGIQIGIVIALHPRFPRQITGNCGVAENKVVSQHKSCIAGFVVSFYQLLRGAATAAAALGTVAMGFVFVHHRLTLQRNGIR